MRSTAAPAPAPAPDPDPAETAAIARAERREREAAAEDRRAGHPRSISAWEPLIPSTTSRPISGTSSAPPAPEQCICGGVGWYAEPVPYGHPWFGRAWPCRCTLDARAQRDAELLAEAAQRERARYAVASFDTYDAARPIRGALTWAGRSISPAQQRATLRAAIERCRVYADRPRGWLYLFGPPGGGKTHIAAAIANRCTQAGRAAHYVSVPNLLAWLQDGMDDNSIERRRQAVYRAPLLVLDDLGQEHSTPWSAAEVRRLIFERYNTAAATVITSNMRRDEHEAALADRIAELAEVVPVLVVSFRRESRPLSPAAEVFDRGADDDPR